MKNNLFNSFSNIDDDLLDMTVKKIKRAKPRRIAFKATGFAAAAAATVFAVNLGVSFVSNNKLPLQETGALSSENSSFSSITSSLKYIPMVVPSKVPELDPKYFEPYQSANFTIDYNNLPFDYKNEGLTRHDARPMVSEYDAFVRYAYDASELVGNNPWNESLDIERLPIFKKKTRNIECSELEKTTEAVKQMNDENGLNLRVEGSAEGGIKILLPEEKYTDFTAKELAEQHKEIAGKYGKLVGLDDAEFSMSHAYSLIGRKYYNTFFYQSSDNAFEAMMNYNFKQVRIAEYGFSFDTYYYGYQEPSALLTLNYTNRFDTLQCSGFYPIISVQKAKERLYNGNFYAPYDNADIEATVGATLRKSEDKIKSVELVYIDTYSDECLPYYRFIVEIDGLEDAKYLHAEGIKQFINVFVPAIDNVFLSDIPYNNLQTESQTESQTQSQTKSQTESETEQEAFYDDTFVGMALQGSGPRTTYNEVMDSLTSQDAKDRGIYIDSFYLVETVQALSIEGYDWDSNNSTIYEVKIIKDLISGEDINRTEKILISNGTPKWQYEYDPAYAPGERFTIALGKPRDGKDFIGTPGSYMFKYDVASGGSGYIYSRCSEMDKLNLPTSENIKETVVTSTTQNPAGYTQKVTLEAVVEFLRSDWKARGVSKHFDGTAS